LRKAPLSLHGNGVAETGGTPATAASFRAVVEHGIMVNAN